MMISCKRAAELTCQSLDRDLTFRERVQHRMHTLMCRGCRAFLVQTRKLDEMLHEHFSSPEPADLEAATAWLPEDACERLKRRLREEQLAGGG